YLGPNPSQSKRLYHGLSWWDNKEYFSFVPCKLNDGKGFERLEIDISDTYFNLSSNPTGKSFLKGTSKTPQEIWEKIVELAFQQGYYLGIRFNEPHINNIILNSFRLTPSLAKAKCNKRADDISDNSIRQRFC
ncbi:MAG: hypothetical protein NT144_03560, partial [Bacteroidia bacterium]|nr:hypothetical protein [Bacteroidia bacterium]